MATRVAFHAQLDDLKRDIVALAVRVKGLIPRAVGVLRAADAEEGRRLVEGDRAIDEDELRLEARCLRLLALQQPVAGDLRFIGAAIRILIDLERIADHAASIARTAVRLQGHPAAPTPAGIARMAELVQDMVARAVDAFVREDAQMAHDLVTIDDEVDHLFSGTFSELVEQIGRHPQAASQLTHLLFAASHLERIGDHATNVAEAVIYAVTGQRPELND